MLLFYGDLVTPAFKSPDMFPYKGFPWPFLCESFTPPWLAAHLWNSAGEKNPPARGEASWNSYSDWLKYNPLNITFSFLSLMFLRETLANHQKNEEPCPSVVSAAAKVLGALESPWQGWGALEAARSSFGTCPVSAWSCPSGGLSCTQLTSQILQFNPKQCWRISIQTPPELGEDRVEELHVIYLALSSEITLREHDLGGKDEHLEVRKWHIYCLDALWNWPFISDRVWCSFCWNHSGSRLDILKGDLKLHW